MIPTVYEWHWDFGHICFMGIFYAVVVAIFATFAVAVFRSFKTRRRILEDEDFPTKGD